MQFDCQFTRRHKTRKEIFRHAGRDFPMSVTQHLRLIIEAEFDPSQPEVSGAFIEYALSCVDEAHPFDPAEWSKTQFEGATELRHEPPLPTPLLREGSLADLFIKRDAREYPTLYGADAYTPYRVMEQWFMTVGNGRGWHREGVLVDRDARGSLAALREKAQVLLAAPLTAEYERDIQDNARFDSLLSDRYLPRPAVHLYPLSEGYSKIFLVPDNVEDSFLCAAVDICRYFLSRPAWECSCYAPHDQEGQTREVYNTDAWRPLLVQDGLRFRQKVHDAYEGIIRRFQERLVNLGWVDEASVVDESLPPVVVRRPLCQVD